MNIRRAKKSDLSAIKDLMALYGNKMSVEGHHINHRDVSLVAVTDEGQIIGFVWAGLMAQNKVAYLDKFTIHPEYAKKGVGQKLALKALEIGKKLGVQDVFGIIKRDAYHDKSAINALKMAFSADREPYTFVRTNVNFMISELEAKNGRK
jgi:N-acetylglutamate synthase-like GNAT family acetyltransferase